MLRPTGSPCKTARDHPTGRRQTDIGRRLTRIEFAAGIMLGGSIGAVIMGALVAQARDHGNDLDRVRDEPLGLPE